MLFKIISIIAEIIILTKTIIFPKNLNDQNNTSAYIRANTLVFY